MLDTPQIAQTTAQTTAIIHVTIPRHAIQDAMRVGIGELVAALAAQGVSTAGPWFTHHLRIDPDVFDFEISVPVAAPVAAIGRVQPSQWPATTVARTVYHGGYDGLGDAWGEFDAWITAAGHIPGPDLWEQYLDLPHFGGQG